MSFSSNSLPVPPADTLVNSSVLESLRADLTRAVRRLIERLAPGAPLPDPLTWEPPKNPEYGDLSTNAAMSLAKPIRANPLKIAEELAAALPKSQWVERVSVTKPGFVNLALSREGLGRMLAEPVEKKERFGHVQSGAGRSVFLEFVSANPTGPLHVGHARHAAVGECLATLLEAAGWKVHREFYINDAGNQVQTLGKSFRARVLQILGEDVSLPEDGYPGDYLLWYAWDFLRTQEPRPAAGMDDVELLGGKDAEHFSTAPVKSVLDDAASLSGTDADDKSQEQASEPELDPAALRAKVQGEWIARARALILEKKGRQALENARAAYSSLPQRQFTEFGKAKLLGMIQATLADLRVTFDHYFSETSLYQTKSVEAAIEELKRARATYENEGALWLRSTEKGDDKDRVLIKSDGAYTYLVPDLAYHRDKFLRRGGALGEHGPDLLVNIFGSDHDGYPPRLKAGLAFMGFPAEHLHVIVMRLVFLMRHGKRLDMGKRTGNFVSARDLLDEAGCDVLRFFLLQRSVNSEINFDLDLAREHSDRNPVFKIQYSHARVCSLFRKAAEKGLVWNGSSPDDIARLTTAEEKDLIRAIASLPEAVEKAARMLEPHHIIAYLLNLADLFNGYWSQAKIDPEYRMISLDHPERTQARLSLAAAYRIAIANGLRLLGVSAPDRMEREEEESPVNSGP